MRSEDIYPLARQLYAEIPEPLRRWSGDPTDAAERDHLADRLLMACDAFGFDVGAEDHQAAVVISEALAGFLTLWSGRYGNLDNDVDRAQAALVSALGGTVYDWGEYHLPIGTPITVAAIAQMIGWVTILEIPER
jgi:hypothetical protein